MRKIRNHLLVVLSFLCLFSCTSTTIKGKFNRVNSSEEGGLLGGLIGAYYASLEFDDGVVQISGFLVPEYHNYEAKGDYLYITMENGNKMRLQIINENLLQGDGLFSGIYIKEGKEHLYQSNDSTQNNMSK